MSKKLILCEIVRNEKIAGGIYDMTLIAPEIAGFAVPGQFAMLYPRGNFMLPRPLSVCSANAETGEVRFVYRIVGRGTEEFSGYAKGDKIRVLGPLGNGYPVLPDVKKTAVVGGGIGIPPLLFLSNELKKTTDLTAVLGFRDETFLVGDFEKNGVKAFIATDNGAAGYKGNAVGLLDSLDEKFDAVYACGPMVMLKSLAEWAEKRETECYVSLEERMGCGFGVCVGCVCEVKGENGSEYKKVCVDGPVFDAKDVKFYSEEE